MFSVEKNIPLVATSPVKGNTGIAPVIGGKTPAIEDEVIAAIALAAVAAL